METKCRTYVKEIRNGIDFSEERNDIIRWLLEINRLLLNNSKRSSNGMLTDNESVCHDMESREYIKKHLSNLLYQSLVLKFSIDWVECITTITFNDLVKPLFLRGPPQPVLFVLVESILESTSKNYRFQKCVMLLEEFLTQAKLREILISSSKSPTVGPGMEYEQELLVSTLASFPDKIANKLRSENSEKFLPQHFVPVLAMAVFDCLQWANDQLTQGKDVSMGLTSALVGKLCIVGFSDHLMDTILPHLSARVRTDYIWCRLCERVFTGVPTRSIEAVVSALLKKISWYGLVEKFLGDCVLNNSSIKLLVCTKLLLHKSFPNPKNVLQNIIGYLSSFHSRRALFIEVMLKLLRVWGDTSSIRHISLEQHLYISRALMLCIGRLVEEEKKKHKNDMLSVLMSGVQTHLQSSDHDVQMLGMTIAKSVTSALDPTGPQLEFEIDKENSIVKSLLEYTDLDSDPGPTDLELETLNYTSEKELPVTEKLEDKISFLHIEEDSEQTDLDSDDDLQPYDMSNDVKVTSSKKPKYVRDCMEGLITSADDPDKTEVCLQEAENLIRKNTDGLQEIAAEFSKILLHFSDTHSFADFWTSRFRAMKALAVVCPKQVSDYLTSQFYERNYNTRQRLDILEVLAGAAQELSEPETEIKVKQTSKESLIAEVSPEFKTETWKEIVALRVESNTRRFGKGRSQSLPVASANRFTEVAGDFFYPLMYRVDHSEPYLDLLGRDSLLLFRLLHTLAIVLYSARSIPAAFRMGKSLLEFTWPLRHHLDTSVRQAVIICSTSVFLSVPTPHLIGQIHTDVTETKIWLEEIVESDPSSECQQLAAQGLLVLQEQIQKGISQPV